MSGNGPANGGGFYLLGIPAHGISRGFSVLDCFSDTNKTSDTDIERVSNHISSLEENFVLLDFLFDVDVAEDLSTLLATTSVLSKAVDDVESNMGAVFGKADNTTRILSQLGLQHTVNPDNNRSLAFKK